MAPVLRTQEALGEAWPLALVCLHRRSCTQRTHWAMVLNAPQALGDQFISDAAAAYTASAWQSQHHWR